MLATLLLLNDRGPQLTGPFADFVKGFRFGNMQELGIQSQGRPIGFDLKREVIMPCASDKSKDPECFCRQMLDVVHEESASYLAAIDER